ncbi:MAG: glutathione S-transferase N-terminal domain-containing protein [bacterium]
MKVRRSAHKLNLPLEYRNIKENSTYRKQLEQGGGMVQVPCLRIDRDDGTEWMYESDDIVEFLETRFG